MNGGDLRLEELAQVLPGLWLPSPRPPLGPLGPGGCSIQGGGSAGDGDAE